MRDGAVLEETMIPLAANGQDSRFIDQVFPTADTSDFVGSVRCLTPEPGLFSAVAFELDGVNRSLHHPACGPCGGGALTSDKAPPS